MFRNLLKFPCDFSRVVKFIGAILVIALIRAITRIAPAYLAERCPSWLKEHDWKSCVLPKAAPRVRIPLSPPFRTWLAICELVIASEKKQSPLR